MDVKVLVVYASKYGSTAEIAEKIGEVLRRNGLNAEVLPVKHVRDLGFYHAVVLGSAVYIGQWRKEAVRFLEKNAEGLAQRATWIFSSGPTGEGDPVKLLQGWTFPPKLRPIVERIQPRDIAVFHGNVDVSKLNFLHKWMIDKVEAPVGDFRDWEVITAWAESIAKNFEIDSSAKG